MSKDIYDKPMMSEKCAAPTAAQTPEKLEEFSAYEVTREFGGNTAVVIADDARKLERERDAARRELAEAKVDAERDSSRLDWLEWLFKRAKRNWPLVALQTIPDQVGLSAVNDYHGKEAGLVTAKTIREVIDSAAIDAAIKASGVRS